MKSATVINQLFEGPGRLKTMAMRGIGVGPDERHHVYASLYVEWDDTFWEGDGHEPADQDGVTRDALQQERNIMAMLRQAGFDSVTDEGHGSSGDLIIRLEFTTGTPIERNFVRPYSEDSSETIRYSDEICPLLGGSPDLYYRGMGQYKDYFNVSLYLTRSEEYEAYCNKWYEGA